MSPRSFIDCTFCGDKGVQRGQEDVLPLWLAKKLAYTAEQLHPGTKPSYVNYGYKNLADFQADKPSRETPSGAIPAAYKLPDVCRSCNGGWMSRLEQAAQLLIPGLMVGKQKLLAPYDQLVLATWMVKTCLTYDASRKPRSIPEAIGSRRFFILACPLPVTHVVIGHDADYTPEGAFVHGRLRLEGSDFFPRDMEAVMIGFQFDHLIIQACINFTEEIPEDGTTTEGMAVPADPQHYERIWPIRDRFLWPSDLALQGPRQAEPGRRDTATKAGHIRS